MFKDEKKDEHFALLRAGFASQQKPNGSTAAGYQIKLFKKTAFPIFAMQLKITSAHGSKVQTYSSETLGRIFDGE